MAISVEYAVERIGRAVRVVHNNGEADISGRLINVLGPWDVALIVEPIPADGSTWSVFLSDVERLYVSG